MGRKEGGIKAATTNRERYGEDYYRQIGSKGGNAPFSKPRGFAAMPTKKVSAAGKKGGKASRRNRSKPE